MNKHDEAQRRYGVAPFVVWRVGDLLYFAIAGRFFSVVLFPKFQTG